MSTPSSGSIEETADWATTTPESWTDFFPAMPLDDSRKALGGVLMLCARPGEAALVGEDDRLDAVAGAQLGENPLHVRLDGGLLDHQRLDDLAVRQAAGDELEHAALAGRQLLEPLCDRGVRRGLAGHASNHRSGDGGREERVAGGDRVDGGDELLRPRALEQEAGGARAERSEDVVVLLEGREDHDPRVGCDSQELTGCGDAVQVGHADVHEDDVRAEFERALDGGPPVSGLADDPQPLVAREDGPEAGAHEVVVVDDEDTHLFVRHDSSLP